MKQWEEFLSNLEQTLSPDAVAKWLRPLKVIRFDAGNLFLEADPIQIAWFEEHIRPILKKQSLVNQNNRPMKIHLGDPAKKKSAPAKDSLPPFSPLSLDPSCTFSNFVSSPGNALAIKLLSEPYLFNPIFLHGPKGSGKTHLLMAAANASAKKVFFTTADLFTDHVVQAIRTSRMQEFRSLYRHIDLLLIDDIHHLAGRAATQEEFFHTFNTLHTLGKPIILTSPLPPSKLQDIEPRLISRFEWGLATLLEKADPSQILRQKATTWNFPLSDELLAYLLATFPTDPILPLQALTIRATTPVTPSSAALLLKDLIKTNHLTPEAIIKALSAHFGLKPQDLLGKSQSREAAHPRQIAMYLCRERLKLSYQAIGKIFDRDHSTVMSSVKQIESNKTSEVLEAIEVAVKKEVKKE